MTDELIGGYEELPFVASRTASLDILELAREKHYVPMLLEIDVTEARAAIRRHKQLGEDISFTAWAVKCVAQAASEHRRVHALRHGWRTLVVFDDVDEALAVYRRLADESMDERLPMPFVMRKANERSVGEISTEVRRAQRMPLAPGEAGGSPSPFTPAPSAAGRASPTAASGRGRSSAPPSCSTTMWSTACRWRSSCGASWSSWKGRSGSRVYAVSTRDRA
jgi:hypothetical protein